MGTNNLMGSILGGLWLRLAAEHIDSQFYKTLIYLISSYKLEIFY